MLNNPFARPGQFYRGNLHGHSTNSDGKLVVAEVVEKYRAYGYDFIAISDHFMEVYDYPITDSRAHRDEDFTTLLAAELHLSKMENSELWHVLAVGLPANFAPPGEQEDIVDLASRAADAGAFIGMVHPTWNGMTPTDAARLPFAHAVEVYNHRSEVKIVRGYGWGLCDQLLNQGRRVSAFAVDDSHTFDNDFGGGWVHVKAQSLEPEALLESLKNGWYYSSQGPLIRFRPRLEGREYRWDRYDIGPLPRTSFSQCLYSRHRYRCPWAPRLEQPNLVRPRIAARDLRSINGYLATGISLGILVSRLKSAE